LIIKLAVHEIDLNQKSRWDELLLTSPNASYRQSFEYEYSGQEKGRRIASFVFSINNTDVAGAHYSLRTSPKIPIKVADILNGIVFRSEPDLDVLDQVIGHFSLWAVSQGAAIARYYPWLPVIIGSDVCTGSVAVANRLEKNGFNCMQQGRHTYWIDITKSEDDILGSMKKQTRYDVRSAIKSDLEIKEHKEFQEDIFEQFWGMYSSLAMEKQFEMLNKEQMLNEMRPLLESGFATIFLIYFHGILMNATIASMIGQGTYLYGAINPAARETPGCPPIGAAAQWTMISAMKQRDLKVYDMGFCPGPIPIKNDPRYNIWRFKHGFGGAHVQFMPVYGKILRGLSGRIFKWYRYGFAKTN